MGPVGKDREMVGGTPGSSNHHQAHHMAVEPLVGRMIPYATHAPILLGLGRE